MAKLTCPICGAATSLTFHSFPVTVYNIGTTTVSIEKRGGEKATAQAVSKGIYGEPTYAIIVCQACGKRFVSEEGYRGWVAVYPIARAVAASEIPEPIHGEFEEAHLCFAVQAYQACLWMARMVLIAAQREQKVSSLKELRDKGVISDMLYGQADQVRLWANVLHDDISHDAITRDDAEQLLLYLSSVLDAVYVQPRRLSDMTKKLAKLKAGNSPIQP